MAAAVRRALRAVALAALLSGAASLSRVRLSKVQQINTAGRLVARAAAAPPLETDVLELAAKMHPVPLQNFMDAQACARRCARLTLRTSACS